MNAATGKRQRSPRRHDPRAASCRRPNRPAIKHGFLRYAAELFVRKIYEERDGETLGELWQFIDGTDPGRATRSDFLESNCLVVYCLLSRVQLRSLRVGFPHQQRDRRSKHDMVGLSRSAIADWCGLSERTVSMVCTLLRRAGLVHGPSRTDRANWIKQPCETVDGTTEWKPAVRRFSFMFFAGLGLGAWLAELREGKAKPAAPAPTVTAASVSKLAGELAEALSASPDG